MKRIASVLILALCLAATAEEEKMKLPDSVTAVLEKAESIELYSLEPEAADEKGDKLYGWLILGKTTLKDKAKKAIVEAAVAAAGKGRGAKCFDPRHAIKATHGDKTVELVICFACSWVDVYEGGKKIQRLPFSGSQATFDKALKDAGVDLAKKAKEK